MSSLDVRIVKLEPMRVASVWAFGESPETEAHEKLRAWAGPKGLLADPKKYRIFGFNTPTHRAAAPSTAMRSGSPSAATSSPRAMSGSATSPAAHTPPRAAKCRRARQATSSPRPGRSLPPGARTTTISAAPTSGSRKASRPISPPSSSSSTSITPSQDRTAHSVLVTPGEIRDSHLFRPPLQQVQIRHSCPK